MGFFELYFEKNLEIETIDKVPEDYFDIFLTRLPL